MGKTGKCRKFLQFSSLRGFLSQCFCSIHIQTVSQTQNSRWSHRRNWATRIPRIFARLLRVDFYAHFTQSFSFSRETNKKKGEHKSQSRPYLQREEEIVELAICGWMQIYWNTSKLQLFFCSILDDSLSLLCGGKKMFWFPLTFRTLLSRMTADGRATRNEREVGDVKILDHFSFFWLSKKVASKQIENGNFRNLLFSIEEIYSRFSSNFLMQFNEADNDAAHMFTLQIFIFHQWVIFTDFPHILRRWQMLCEFCVISHFSR